MKFRSRSSLSIEGFPFSPWTCILILVTKTLNCFGNIFPASPSTPPRCYLFQTVEKSYIPSQNPTFFKRCLSLISQEDHLAFFSMHTWHLGCVLGQMTAGTQVLHLLGQPSCFLELQLLQWYSGAPEKFQYKAGIMFLFFLVVTSFLVWQLCAWCLYNVEFRFGSALCWAMRFNRNIQAG
jgi:hypothetical protein